MTRLLVVGGGPAGLATAVHAARAGLDVVLRERREGPVDKACGEGLLPGTLRSLAGLGVDPPGRPFTGIRYVDAARPGRSATADFSAGPGRGVRRTVLHDALASAARAAGVVVEQRTVREVRTCGDRVEVDGDRFDHVVAADGLRSPVRRTLGLDRPAPRWAPRRHAVRAHARVAPWSSHVEVHWSSDGEAYVTPVADDLVGVAVLTGRRAPYDELLAGFPLLAERLRGATWDGPVLGSGALHHRASSVVAGRVLLVGDAGGYVDAATGEGIGLALAQAEAAVRAVVDGDLRGYADERRRLTRRYRATTSALVLATRSAPVRCAVVPAASAFPPVFRGAVNSLGTG